FADHVLHAVSRHVDDRLTGFLVDNYGPDRDLDNNILRVLPTLVAAPVGAVFGLKPLLQAQVVEGTAVTIGDQNEVAAATSVGPVGASSRHVFFPVKTHRTRTAAPGNELHHGFIQKHRRKFTGWLLPLVGLADSVVP